MYFRSASPARRSFPAASPSGWTYFRSTRSTGRTSGGRLPSWPCVWPLHTTHHAALESTTLTDLRAHPIERAWQTLAHTIARATVGFPIDASILFEVLANTQQFLNHSNATALAPFEKLGIVTP